MDIVEASPTDEVCKIATVAVPNVAKDVFAAHDLVRVHIDIMIPILRQTSPWICTTPLQVLHSAVCDTCASSSALEMCSIPFGK